MEGDSHNYNLARIEYILSGIMYGTIGWILRYVNLPTEIVVCCRGVIGTLFVLGYLKLRKITLNKVQIKENLLYLFLSGACLGLNWVFLFASYHYTSVAIGTLCNYMGPIIVILISPLVFHEKLTPVKIVCVSGALIGTFLISGVFDLTTFSFVSSAAGGTNLFGVFLGLLSALGFVGLVIFNKKLKGVNSYDKAVSQLTASFITVLPYAIFVNMGKSIVPDTASIIWVVILGIIHTGLAYCFYFRALGTLKLLTFSILGYIEPVVAIFVSTVFLKEPLTINSAVGAVLILGAAISCELFK